MTQIFIFTASASEAREHLRASIQNPLDPNEVVQYFNDEERPAVQAIAADHGLFAWGAVPGPRNEPTWKAMKTGDWVLCVYEGWYRYAAKLVGKFENAPFARHIWGETEEGSTWRFMYFMTKPQPIGVPLEQVGDYLNRRYMGFTRISDDKVNAIERDFDSVDDFVQQQLIDVEGEQTQMLDEHPLERITREDVLAALRLIDAGEMHGFGDSTSYDLLHKGKRYPPKAAAGIAAIRTLGRALRPDEFSAGETSQNFRVLRRLGFEIVPKEPKVEASHFIIRSNVDARYADLIGERYHYSSNVPNHLRIRNGARVVVDQKGPNGAIRLLGHGLLGPAQPVPNVEGAPEFNSPFVEWIPFEPPRLMTEELLGRLRQEPRYNVQHSIRAISQELFDALTQGNGLPPEIEPERPEVEMAYTLEDACTDVFMNGVDFQQLLDLFRSRKNLILQGAPGTGKSHVAKRLGFALMGAKAQRRLQMIQFHQAYSYEDFLGGFRPTQVGQGAGFTYKQGVFARFCDQARREPQHPFVFIIDEINRGNLSKILGEAMLVIEHDKRGAEWAISLAYAPDHEPRFFVPENVFILGLMNTADRSLAMVDYALRRRFAFRTLNPAFGLARFGRFLTERGISEEIVQTIDTKFRELNEEIVADRDLGKGFVIGHSFFSNPPSNPPDGGRAWYKNVIETEIEPLLREYWFDKTDDDLSQLVADLLG